MKESKSEFSARELKDLKSYVSLPAIGGIAVLFAVIAAVVALIFMVANKATTDLGIGIVWWPYPTLGALGLMFLFWRRRTRSVRADIRSGYAIRWSYELRRALKFDEIEDEGDTFVFEDFDGNAYYIAGQEIPRTFPKENVVLSKAPVSEMYFSIRMSGDRLKPFVAKDPFHDCYLYQKMDPKDLHKHTATRLDDAFDTILAKTPHA